jgi:phosphoribosylaminoimidazolecarboxamide formyltransferase/IMP cyclohydrolase
LADNGGVDSVLGQSCTDTYTSILRAESPSTCLPKADSTSQPVRRALISVSDKTGILDFVRALINLNIQILSTGGTASLLREANLPVVEVADYTGFPEMMEGRVKTLHPKIHGGLLAREQDEAVLKAHGIDRIDLLVVNLYPFQATINKPNCALEDAIENIDVGGPAMLRGAAKNYANTTVLVDPQDYEIVLRELEKGGHTSLETRFELARKTFAHTSQYDGMIANYLGKEKFPRDFSLQVHKKMDLRYGENPHQAAAFYVDEKCPPASIAGARLLQGKALSYNNIADSDTALECVKSVSTLKEKLEPEFACVIVKHANPCGVAIAKTQLEAYQRAYEADSSSAFGGIIAFDTELELKTLETILQQQFVEVIIAPHIASEGVSLAATKPNVRLLSCGDFALDTKPSLFYSRVNGGLLVQDQDDLSAADSVLKTVTQVQPALDVLSDLAFAWIVAKFVKSNAIVYVKDRRTLGIGGGQSSRIMSAKIAAMKAQEANLSVQGAIMASDAFFPFRDGIDAAASVGITAIIQPGGSMRDNEVITAADEHKIAMVFTGVRHFRH